MSGSSDPNWDGKSRSRRRRAADEPRDDVVTGPVTYTHSQFEDELQTRPTRNQELHAPVDPSEFGDTATQGPVVPASSVTGHSLMLVILIMCFLACLTAGAVYMINQSAEAWLHDMAGEIIVQIEPQENVDTNQTIAAVSAFLDQQPGIAGTRAVSLEDSTKLLEPWLGQTDALESLPVPRLVAVALDRSADPPDLDKLRTQIASKFPGVVLDDHRHWQRQIRTVTRSFALGGIAILLLVAAATTAIIVSATRSALLSNREIVEVLHFVGATDGFIAREFERHFLRLGIKAGVLGALLAALVFLAMPSIMLLLGGGSVTLIELQRFIGSGSLDTAGYILLGIVVVVIAALCMLTSRFGVYRILSSKI